MQEALGNSARIVKKNGQAVTLYFTTWPNVDIVPAAGYGNPLTHFEIPDANRGAWISTQPSTHDTLIARLPLAGRQLIRMIKAWNHAHSEYMRSFHVETLAARNQGVTEDWPWEVYKFFKDASETIGLPLYHPDSRNGRVDDYLDAYDRNELSTRLTAACQRALSAWSIVHNNGDQQEAIRLYRIIFGDDFPAYG